MDETVLSIATEYYSNNGEEAAEAYLSGYLSSKNPEWSVDKVLFEARLFLQDIRRWENEGGSSPE